MVTSTPCHNFLLLQALFARWLQACLGNPTLRKGHVYYTKLITNATKLQIAITAFTVSRICYKIVHRVYFMGPNETLISLRSFLPIVIFNIRHGSILVSLLTLSRGIIHLVKSVIRIPRPYESFPYLVQSDKRKFNTFSFPSQSMQSIAIVYGAMFRQCNMAMFYYLLLLLIGFSRVYRGLHYPYDVIASFLLGDYLQQYIIMMAMGSQSFFWVLFVLSILVKLYWAKKNNSTKIHN